MRILVTGRTGQVVSSLMEKAASLPNIRLLTFGRPEFDLADATSVLRGIVSARPDLVISAAAYTAVDRAEDEPDKAYAVNAIGAGAVAEAAARIGAPIIHLSTDYVFSGDDSGPYHEDSAPAPKSIYGLTKLEGERAVARLNPQHVIIRTSWVYSPFGSNFVKTMLRLAESRASLQVVADQWGSPTSALDIADALLLMSARLNKHRYGIYHLTGGGSTNWSGFARHIFGLSRAYGGPHADVLDIPAAEYPSKVRRPVNSCLSSDKFDETFGWRPPDWRRSTETVVRRLVLERCKV